MPTGGDPPTPDLPQSIFNALHAMTHDASAWAFKDGSLFIYMFVEKIGTNINQGKWFYATDGDGGINPRAQIPSNTYTVIKNGTYNTSDGTVSYSGNNYRFRIERDLSAGKQVAKAIVV